MRPLRRIALCAVLGACGHETPFGAGSYGPDGPHSPGVLTRLTFNTAADRMPVWVPDGAGLWYAFGRTDRADRDHCLARLPAAGGARVETRCHRSLAAEDSTDVLEAPGPAPDGRLAFVHVTGRVGALTPDGAELVIAARDGAPARALSLPYGPPNQRGYDRARFVQWVGDTLVFVATYWLFVQDRLLATTDTLEIGAGIDMLRPGDATPLRVPLTDNASSVAAGDTAGVLYFTLNGDSRVFRLGRATGDTATLHDFGALGIARDVQVRSGRLVAVVGGDVATRYDTLLALAVQDDEGGYLYWVDLATGVPTQLPDTAFRYRRPALSPDGRRVVAEARGPGGEDLWMVQLP